MCMPSSRRANHAHGEYSFLASSPTIWPMLSSHWGGSVLACASSLQSRTKVSPGWRAASHRLGSHRRIVIVSYRADIAGEQMRPSPPRRCLAESEPAAALRSRLGCRCAAVTVPEQVVYEPHSGVLVSPVPGWVFACDRATRRRIPSGAPGQGPEARSHWGIGRLSKCANFSGVVGTVDGAPVADYAGDTQ